MSGSLVGASSSCERVAPALTGSAGTGWLICISIQQIKTHENSRGGERVQSQQGDGTEKPPSASESDRIGVKTETTLVMCLFCRIQPRL